MVSLKGYRYLIGQREVVGDTVHISFMKNVFISNHALVKKSQSIESVFNAYLVLDKVGLGIITI